MNIKNFHKKIYCHSNALVCQIWGHLATLRIKWIVFNPLRSYCLGPIPVIQIKQNILFATSSLFHMRNRMIPYVMVGEHHTFAHMQLTASQLRCTLPKIYQLTMIHIHLQSEQYRPMMFFCFA